MGWLNLINGLGASVFFLVPSFYKKEDTKKYLSCQNKFLYYKDVIIGWKITLALSHKENWQHINHYKEFSIFKDIRRILELHCNF